MLWFAKLFNDGGLTTIAIWEWILPTLKFAKNENCYVDKLLNSNQNELLGKILENPVLLISLKLNPPCS